MSSQAWSWVGVALVGAGAIAGCGDDTGGAGGSGGAGSTTTTSSGGGEGGGSTTTTTTTTTTTGTGGSGTGGSGTGGEGGGMAVELPTEADCAEECEESQEGECSLITGNCNTCCGAAVALAPTACGEEFADYYACVAAGSPTACNATCSAEETALSNCAVAYCTSNLNNPNCATLAGCFN
jgi:trimeric autotransporter adhesin